MAWDPTQIASLAYWMPTFATHHMWVEASSGTALTRVAADADLVGQIDDPSPACHRATALSSGGRPALASGGGRLSSIVFTAASTNFLSIENSLTAFNFAHQAGATSICIWVLKATDGTVMQIFDSCAGTSSNAGINLQTTAANKLILLIEKASAGNNVVFYTTTQTLVVADGWTPVTITLPAGAGTATGTIQIGSHTAETFNQAAGGAAGTNAHANLSIGALSGSNAQPFNGSLSDLIIVNAVMSGADLTSFRAYNPARSGVSLATATNTSVSSLTMSGLNFLQQWHDFSDAAHLWQDTANSVAVAIDADPIRSAQNKSSSVFTLNRDAQANSTGTRPLYKTNITGGSACGLWDGVDDNLILQSDWQKAGAMTVFLVCKYTGTTQPPHVMEASATQYWTITGSAYVGDTSATVLHTSDTGFGPHVTLVNPDGWNIYEFVRNGSTLRLFCNGIEEVPCQTNGQSNMTQIGFSNSSVLFWLGYVAEIGVYRAMHTDGNRSLVRAGLAAKYGITNVKTLNAGGSSRGRSRVGG